MNKYEMPIVLVGNNLEESQRKVSFEEAKNLSDKYGLKYHEISVENKNSILNEIFKDLGEQVLYQEILDKNKIKEIKSKGKVDIKEKKTLLQKKREDEVREKRIKREKEMELLYKKKEREGIENKKKKAIEDKQKLIEKIKIDKMIQKKREKEAKEELLNEKKEKYEKSKKEREEGEKKNNLEKEKNKLLFEKKRKSEKENLKKLLQENEQNEKEYLKKQREKIRSPRSSKISQKKNIDPSKEIKNINNTVKEFNIKGKNNLNESKILKRNQTTANFLAKKNENISKNEKNTKKIIKSKSLKKLGKEQNKNDNEKAEQKLKEIKINMEEIQQKENEEKLNQEQLIIKNELKEQYLNCKCNIYRCLFCHLIPNINIDEFNHQIETYCICKAKNINNDYIFSYKYFEEKSLDHPINENITCFDCKKTINVLNNENSYLNFCNICNEIICSKDEINHKENRHSKKEELKEKYKNLTLNINKKTFEEKLKSKNYKTKNSNDYKNNLLTPSKSQAILKKFNQTPKENKNRKEEKKTISSKKNLASSNKKTNNKKNFDKNKNTEKNNTSNINEEENLIKIENEKLPFYLIDSCCIKHDKIYNHYCYDCFKNICDICQEKEHKNHNLEKLSDVMLDEEKILNIKQSLEKDINDLSNINNCFNHLIEKIKHLFSYFYSLKKKEIEIKQKIIKDYETIKYNYNSIQNVCKINYNYLVSNKNEIMSNLEILNNKNNNNYKNILSELNLIFNYLNESSQNTNLLKFYNKVHNFIIENRHWEITDMIQFGKNNIAISFFDGSLYIYDTINFNLKLSCKIFDNNMGINQMIQLTNGDMACCGYKKIKIVNINLDRKNYYICKEINIKNGSFNFIKELSNNYLITYDSNNKIKIWYKYESIYEYNNKNIDFLLTIKDNLFLTSSNNKNIKQLNLYNININKNNNIESNCFLLDNISVVNLKNSLIKLNNCYVIALVSYEEQNDFSEKLEERKSNEENNENGICLIEINNKNELTIRQNIKNKNEKYTNLINYINNSFLAKNDLGIIELWHLDKNNQKLIILNKFKAFDIASNEIINNMIFIEDNKKIIFQTYKKLICFSHK